MYDVWRVGELQVCFATCQRPDKWLWPSLWLSLAGAVLNSVEVKTNAALGQFSTDAPFGKSTAQFLRQLEASVVHAQRTSVHGCLTSGSRWVFVKFTIGSTVLRTTNSIVYTIHDYGTAPKPADAQALLDVLLRFGTNTRKFHANPFNVFRVNRRLSRLTPVSYVPPFPFPLAEIFSAN